MSEVLQRWKKCRVQGKSRIISKSATSDWEKNLTIVFYFKQPRHFRARQKSTDIRRMSVSSDAVDSKDNIKTEPMEVIKLQTCVTFINVLWLSATAKIAHLCCFQGDSESRDSEGFSRPATPAQLNELPKRPKLEPKEDRSSPTEVCHVTCLSICNAIHLLHWNRLNVSQVTAWHCILTDHKGISASVTNLYLYFV